MILRDDLYILTLYIYFSVLTNCVILMPFILAFLNEDIIWLLILKVYLCDLVKFAAHLIRDKMAKAILIKN